MLYFVNIDRNKTLWAMFSPRQHYHISSKSANVVFEIYYTHEHTGTLSTDSCASLPEVAM
jgi:hypothetical protein